jgi:hypothetical protein
MPSPSEGHPTSPVLVATQAVPSTPGANTPETLVTLHTGNPRPMSFPVGGTSAGVGWMEAATPPAPPGRVSVGPKTLERITTPTMQAATTATETPPTISRRAIRRRSRRRISSS